MKLNLTYRLGLTTLTPLHIGSGVKLRQGFDFITHQDGLWIANQATLMQAILENAEAKGRELEQVISIIGRMTLAQLKSQDWLQDEHFDLKKGLFRYYLAGRTSTQDNQGELHEFIKDVYGQPYLPGSSLKGALRSVFLRLAAEKDTRNIDINKGPIKESQRSEPVKKKDGRHAGDNIEIRYFRPANDATTHSNIPDARHMNQSPSWKERNKENTRLPYYDLWRSVLISDFSPIPVNQLALAMASIFPIDARNKEAGKRLDLDIEAIPRNVPMTGLLQVHRWFYEDKEARDLHFSRAHFHQLTSGMIGLVNQDTKQLLRDEILFLQQVQKEIPGAGKTAFQAMKSLDYLVNELLSLKTDEFMIALGRGAGWRSKTLGRVLTDMKEKFSDEQFEQLVKDYNLGKGKWVRGRRVPLTRMLASTKDQVLAPMGWVKVKMEAIE